MSRALASRLALVRATSTRADRGAKAQHYLRIPALREYVLVNHALWRVEVFRKNDAQRFEWFTFEEHEEAELASLGVRIPVAEIYRDPLAEG